jgi:hypothetical protein
MTMRDAEWARWQEDFRAMIEPPSASQLRRHVARHGRLLRLAFWGEIAVAIAVVLVPLGSQAIAPAPWKWGWAAALIGFTAIAMTFAAINRRGTWVAVDDSLVTQLELTELRCRRMRRTLLFVPILLAGEVAVVILLIAYADPSSLPGTYVLLGAASLVTAVSWVAARAHVRRRMAEVAALRRELTEANDA